MFLIIKRIILFLISNSRNLRRKFELLLLPTLFIGVGNFSKITDERLQNKIYTLH